MPSQVQLINGAFEDAQGNPLANGRLDLVLSQDGVIPGVGQICAGVRVKIVLDENGNATTNPAQLVWGNDQLSPANSYYAVSGFRANGERVWGPHNQQITGATPFNLNNWVPNVLSSWTPSPQSVLFEVNGVKAGSQTLVNLAAGTNTTITDSGAGTLTIASSGGGGITLKTNGTNNGSQTTLNLASGSNITVTDNGSGTVTISASGVATQKYETATNPAGTTASASAFAYKGKMFIPSVAIDIYEVWGYLLTPVSGATYNALLCQVGSPTSASTTLSTTPSFGTAVTNGTGTIASWFRIAFSSPVTLAAGTPYLMAFGRTDGSDTYALPLIGTVAGYVDMQIPVANGFLGRIASASPASGATVDTNSSSTLSLSIGCVWALH